MLDPTTRTASDLEDFFENGALALHIVGPDGTVLRANKAELELLGYKAEEYCGRNIADFHADRATIDDILARLSRGERIIRYRARLKAKDGSIKHVEITSSVQFENGRFLNTRCFTSDVTELRLAKAAVKEKEKLLQQILDALPAAVYTTDAEGYVTYFNQAAENLAGRTPQLGDDQWCVTWRLRDLKGQLLPHEDCPMAIALKEQRPIRGAEAFAERPDGTLVAFAPYPTPLFDKKGKLTGAVNMLVDISDQKQREAQIHFVMQELSHRSKNLLAIVQSVANRTIKHSASFEEFQDKFMSRIQVMSRMHDLLVANEWVGADIREILETEIGAFLDDGQIKRVNLTGSKLLLTPSTAQSLSLAVHELATNAVKYGALADDEGRIQVGWQSDKADAILFQWKEIKSVPTVRPERNGFGTQLLTALFQNARLDFAQTGLSFSGVLPYVR